MIPERGFPQIEFEQRLEKAQRLMSEKDLDVMFFCTEAEVRYFTGFLTQFWQSPTRPWFVVLPSSGKPVALIPSIGAPLMRHCYTEDIISWASPAADDDGITLVADVIRQHVTKDGSLGMLMGRETAVRMPLADLFALQQRLGTIHLRDMTADIQQIRMVKSPAEQAKLRHICGIVSDVFASAATCHPERYIAFTPALTCCTACPPVKAPKQFMYSSVSKYFQSFSAPFLASVLSGCREPLNLTTSSAE